MNIDSLKEQYRKEQDDIAKKRKNGLFSSEEEDIKAQEKSWENFLIKKYEITKSKKDRDEVFEYFAEKTNSNFVKIRDDYYSKKISLSKMTKMKKKLFIDFENKMLSLGIAQKKSPEFILDKYLRMARNVEIVNIRRRKGINKFKMAVLCGKQFPIARKYFENFKKNNCYDLSDKTNKILLENKKY